LTPEPCPRSKACAIVGRRATGPESQSSKAQPSLLSSVLPARSGRTHQPDVRTRTSSTAHPGRGGIGCPITQIYEGTNQIQRVVIAKRLLG
jgi:hypothetical protein